MLKIHTQTYLLFIIGFSILILNLSLANASSFIITESDYDGDGIDDKLEDSNRRFFQFEFEENETIIRSILNSDINTNLILVKLTTNENGLKINVSYESAYQSSADESEQELKYSITINKIIEYIDSNGNNIYVPSEDQLLQEISLDSWNPVIYSNFTNNNRSTIHSFHLNTSNNLFLVQLYFVEEYERINGSLITPNEAKIDIKINNFNYTNPNSQIALCIKLEDKNEFKEVEETEDEHLNYASEERGIIATSPKGFTGFFTWNQKVNVDGVLKNASTSQVMIDDEDETRQKIYINYPRGSIIIHDPKIGIYRIVNHGNFWLILVIGISSFCLILGSISIPVYYKYKKATSVDSLDEFTDKELLYRLIEGKIKNEDNIKNVNVTVLPNDFIEKVNHLDLDEEEKKIFIKEMLSLSPKEIEKILDEMLNSNNSWINHDKD
ncbi:MAG: hypothetical protein ACFFDF_00075 [Candidatus Odinarchaeota archaeon]